MWCVGCEFVQIPAILPSSENHTSSDSTITSGPPRHSTATASMTEIAHVLSSPLLLISAAMPKVSPQKRARIAALLSTGLSTRDIARRERVSHTTVSRLRHVDHADGNYEDAPRSGRPRLLTDRHERLIVRMVVSGKCQTAVDVQSHLRTDENVNVSANTACSTAAVWYHESGAGSPC